MTPKNKKILFIITQLELGGAQRFLLGLLARIRTKYDILVAFGPDGKSSLENQIKDLGISCLKLKNLRRNINPLSDIKSVIEINKLITKYAPDDLFLLSSKAGFIGSVATIFPKRIKNIKVIYRIGGWSFNDPRPELERKLWLKLEKYSARLKDWIIVNSELDLVMGQNLGIKPKNKIIKINNGLDAYNMAFSTRDDARNGLAKATGADLQSAKIIGTIANLYPPKGFEHLLETAEYFKNTDSTFVIIGDGPERPRLEKIIKEKNLDSKVLLAGQIKGAPLIPAFDIFVLPSLKEGFPWVILEAMAAKVPIIATRVGAIPEIIEDGRTGFIVQPGNSASLAAKIKKLLVDDHLRQEMAISAHQNLLFNFSEEKMLREVEEVL